MGLLLLSVSLCSLLLKEIKAGPHIRGFEPGTEVEVLEEHQLLAYSPYLLHLAILYHPGPLPKSGLILSDLGPPTFISNQEDAILNSLLDNYMSIISQLRALLK